MSTVEDVGNGKDWGEVEKKSKKGCHFFFLENEKKLNVASAPGIKTFFFFFFSITQLLSFSSLLIRTPFCMSCHIVSGFKTFSFLWLDGVGFDRFLIFFPRMIKFLLRVTLNDLLIAATFRRICLFRRNPSLSLSLLPPLISAYNKIPFMFLGLSDLSILLRSF